MKKAEKLFNFIFEQMEKLEEGEISIQEGQVQANLAKQANNTLRIKLLKKRS